ncbi:hypothetical protein DB347_19735 [Opitutaceae bacterium EW11]|nr:hypothetical protein DB347_19735 [Opitutaceae bacterium EW11]
MLKVEVVETADTVNLVVEGQLTGSGLVEIIRQHYGKLSGKACIWDLRKAAFHDNYQVEFGPIATAARETFANARRISPTKVAYVVSGIDPYLIMCKYMMHANSARIPVEYSVFKDMAEAQAWIANDRLKH